MRLLNEIMTRCDSKNKEEGSNFEQFEKLMTDIFEKSYKPEENNFGQNQKKKEEKPIEDLK
jgi:hypothetical protein